MLRLLTAGFPPAAEFLSIEEHEAGVPRSILAPRATCILTCTGSAATIDVPVGMVVVSQIRYRQSDSDGALLSASGQERKNVIEMADTPGSGHPADAVWT